MENNTKILIGVGLAAAVGYYIWKKKQPATAVTTPVTTTTPVVAKPLYPAGLKEGSYIRLGSDATVYHLVGGKKLPVTYNWMVQYASDKWDSVIEIDPAVGMDIPVGETLVA